MVEGSVPKASDEKFLLSAIHRETVEEAGQKRRGNKRYTGRAWFAEPR